VSSVYPVPLTMPVIEPACLAVNVTVLPAVVDAPTPVVAETI